MTDIFTKEKRSEIMSKVKGKNTQLEMGVRKELWQRGIRYRIHCKSLPGTPDISSKKNKLAIFIDGCFWHGCPKHSTIPATNTAFWEQKIKQNINKRKHIKKELRNMNYTVLEYFECELKNDFNAIIEEIVFHFNSQVNGTPQRRRTNQ
jgi:DNA mismatch endonuclease (patch repair protein)